MGNSTGQENKLQLTNARGSRWHIWELNTPGRDTSHTFMSFNSRSSPSSSQWSLEKNPFTTEGGGKQTFWNTPRVFCSSYQGLPSKETILSELKWWLGFYQSLTHLGEEKLQPSVVLYMEEGKYVTPATSSFLVSSMEVGMGVGCWETVVKVTAQGHRVTKRLIPNHRTTECCRRQLGLL